MTLGREMVVVDAAIKANPYPLYARLRAETPVCRALYGASRSRVWMVTRYQDVVMVLKDSRFSNDPRKREAQGTVRSKVLSLIFARLLNNMLNCDQPDHTRLRGLVHQAFTPKRIEELRQRIQAKKLGCRVRLRRARSDDDYCRDAGDTGEGSGKIPKVVKRAPAVVDDDLERNRRERAPLHGIPAIYPSAGQDSAQPAAKRFDKRFARG